MVAENIQNETEEQKEVRLYYRLKTIRYNIVNLYEGIKIEEIEDKIDKEIVEIIRKIDRKYKIIINPKNKTLENIKELEKWCEENGRRPRKCIEGVKTTKIIEEETKEQKEARLGNVYRHVKLDIAKKYKGKKLEEIENKTIREIVKRIRQIDEKYKTKPNQEKRALEDIAQIEQWCEENGRKPRRFIDGVNIAKKGEQESEEQKEIKLRSKLQNIRYLYYKENEGKSLEEIEDEIIREIVKIIRQIDEKYKSYYELLINERNIIFENIIKIEQWCEKEGKQPRKCIAGVKIAKKGENEDKEQKELKLGTTLSNIKSIYCKEFNGEKLEEIEDEIIREIVRKIRDIEEKYPDNRKNNKYITIKNLEELENWCKENKRKPKKIHGIKTTKNREEETAEQRETRLGTVYYYIRNSVIKKYEGKNLEEIEDEIDRKIVERFNGLDELIRKAKEKRKGHFVQRFGNEKMKKLILNLIKTKNANEEQLMQIADFYGVDMGKIINVHEER